MRCAGCAGQIPEGSQFCGVCGRGISHAPLVAGQGGALAGGAGGGTSAEAALDAEGSLSLFELPVSPTARRTKIILVLALDAILAGAGIAMILSYLAAASAPARPAGPAPRLVEALEPRPVIPAEPASDAGPAAQKKDEVKPRSGSRRAGDDNKSRRKPATPEPALAEEGSVDEPPAAPADDRSDGDNVGDAGPGHDAGSADVEAEVAQIASRMAAAVARRQGELERCYQSAAKSAGPEDPLNGRISVRFTLMPNGSTSQARVVRDDIGSVALARCVLDRFQSWPMPAGVSQPIELEWPFEFHAPTP